MTLFSLLDSKFALFQLKTSQIFNLYWVIIIAEKNFLNFPTIFCVPMELISLSRNSIPKKNIADTAPRCWNFAPMLPAMMVHYFHAVLSETIWDTSICVSLLLCIIQVEWHWLGNTMALPICPLDGDIYPNLGSWLDSVQSLPTPPTMTVSISSGSWDYGGGPWTCNLGCLYVDKVPKIQSHC